MKKVLSILLIAVITLSVNSLFAQGNAKKAAEDIITAYKDKDVALLKKYMTGIMLYAISDDFFESGDGKDLAEIAKSWDGGIKEIRYSKGDMMGKTVLLSSAYFSENPNGNINVVIMSSYEGSEWKAFTYGIVDITKKEFEEGSKEIPKDEPVIEVKKAINDHSEFSIEMANGDTFDKPTTEKLKEQLKKLNNDNFFLILNSKQGFLQASTSEKGYIVQYSDDSGMFEAEAYFTFEMLTNIFITYIDNENWKEKAKWIAM